MKKILFVFALFAMVSVAAFSQSKTYRVKKGETIESIAYKHGISVGALLQANPHALDNCYVGMQLVIPSASYNYGAAETQPAVSVKRPRVNSRQGDGDFATEVDVQFVWMKLDPRRSSDIGFGLGADVGYQYYMIHNLFIEGFVGYRWYMLWMDDSDVAQKVHNISFPVHLGGHIDVTDNFGFRPFFGPRVDIPFTARDKNGNRGGKTRASGGPQGPGFDPGVGVTLEFGLDFQFGDWGIRTKYGMGVGKYKDSNYATIGVIGAF